MKIDKDQMAETFIAGKTSDGRNVVYVATHGGLHAFFCKDKEGNISAIGAAPHRAISRFLAEKKEPGIKWNEEFNKSENLQKMGLKGDWKKEGYTLHIGEPESITPGDDTDLTDVVIARHPDGREVGRLNLARMAGGTAYPRLMEVSEHHRRKGLGSAMYSFAEKHWNTKMVPGNRSEDAKALWNQPNRPFGKSEEETFQQLRKFMFAEAPLQKNESSDIFVVYDVYKQEISFMKKEEIIEGLKNKTLSKYALARDLSCSIDATCIAHIPDFEGVE